MKRKKRKKKKEKKRVGGCFLNITFIDVDLTMVISPMARTACDLA